MTKSIITYRSRFNEKDIMKMPYYQMGGGAGHFSSTITVPKYNGPSTHGYELLVNNVYKNLQMLFEEGNINGTARFNKMTQCLGGIAETKWQNLIATANYQPPAARTNANFDRAFQDFTSKLHTNTYLGNDLQEATKNFEWNQMKTYESQNYPDDITTQEARLAQIDDWAVNRCHFQGNPLDDAGKIRRMMKRLPQGYKRFLKLHRGVDPFDPVNPPTLEDLIEILDEYWTDRKEAADRESAKKNNKRNRDNDDDQGGHNKKRRPNNGGGRSSHRNGGGKNNHDRGAIRDVVVAIKAKESRKRCRKTIGLSYSEESRPSGPSTSSIPNPLIGIMMPPRNTITTLTGMAARGIGGAEKSSVIPFKRRRRSVTNAKASRIISNSDNLPCLHLQLVILQAKATMANHLKVSR